MGKLDVSVVIGFRDWGTERIKRSAASIISGFANISGELIISDYGSSDPGPARVVAEQLGAKYVYTPGDPVWSRSRALNAGFAIAQGELLISTDADMLFSPKSMEVIVATAREAGQCALFLQCRDLPEMMGDDYFAGVSKVDWLELEKVGRLRPRWGMGGMMAISAKGFGEIRGFDERLHTYAGEDLDFAQRARRAGYKTVWVNSPDVRMYHMWHTPTIRTVEESDEGRAAVAFNRDVVYNDKTYVRNISEWRHAPQWKQPLVSVVFSTRDRSELLSEAIQSVLAQSVQDFEVIIIDDGSVDDATRLAVQAFGDPRLRYFHQPSSGISAARNLALDESLGYFTAVMDDDDLMHPRRLEWQLAAITDDYIGSAGSFVNFDNESGQLDLIVSRVPSVAQAAEKGGAPGHGTWMLRTDVMRAIRYDESIPSGVDNNFFLRLLRAGYRVSHCGKPILLRRRHSKQVTAVDSSNQGDAAKQALQFFRFKLTSWHLKKLSEEAAANSWPSTTSREEMLQEVLPYLPDHLVTRDATLQLDEGSSVDLLFDGRSGQQTILRDGEKISSTLTVAGASYRDLATLARLGGQLTAHVSQGVGASRVSWVGAVIDDYVSRSSSGSPIHVFSGSACDALNESATIYSMDDGSSREKIGVVSNVARASSGHTPWLIVGSSAERYWA
ncbi:glycosyltransferase [Brachybacterium sp. AOP29-B2-41]|uniref:glycosyltransferase n=1 Tax=Brachybacterium sp. AOP29-B2-41 TaxID=3457704 RepID=UPI0040339374